MHEILFRFIFTGKKVRVVPFTPKTNGTFKKRVLINTPMRIGTKTELYLQDNRKEETNFSRLEFMKT